MAIKRIILTLMLFALTGCAATTQYTGPVPSMPQQSVPGIQHRVEPKQTLWRISRIYNVDIEDILQANNISEEATIEIGQVLVIPVSRSRPQKEQAFPIGDEFIWPLKGKVLAGFGATYRNLINRGINIQVSSDSDILASSGGKVVFYSSDMGNFGKTLIIDHGNGLRSVYSRAAEFYVHPGDNVQRGALIGRAGPTFKGKSNYFHFEIRKGAVPQNPLFYLP